MRGTISAMGAESRAMNRPAGASCTPTGEIVEALGGEIVLIDLVPGHSTTSMVERSRAPKRR